MSETTAHINFIAASYAAAVVIIGALIAWITIDYRAQRQMLAELEDQGVTRRSNASRGDRAIEQVKATANAQAKERA
ncbi:MAG TPA: heme exporter protein CcmD [Xanthobacteraceae bacterium]|jgi:heme exporter protein D|nr:heme exporter protein CcmD [Xanthobacteraceae bacterium]